MMIDFLIYSFLSLSHSLSFSLSLSLSLALAIALALALSSSLALSLSLSRLRDIDDFNEETVIIYSGVVDCWLLVLTGVVIFLKVACRRTLDDRVI